ncbi:putative DNA binding domain-containing protein [Candidatus Woesearchaeota archaeon]|nr:putative DNA binding domain-containing protein [Candidatus Woesearchaeota archaeon]
MKESQTVEFKKSLAEINEILETISAFSNTKGGKILVGIEENKDGTIKEVVGITIKGKEIENLTNEIKQNTDPVIFPSIEFVRMGGKEVLSVEVEENQSKPVFAKGRAYKRVGRSSIKLSIDEIRNLTKESVNYSFTDMICKDAKMEDIDWDFVRKEFIPLYESISERKVIGKPEEFLESLQCLKGQKVTNAGILLFGKTPLKFLMNAYIAAARYKREVESTERLDYKEFTGNLFQQIDACDKYIKENIVVMSRQHPYRVQREDIPEYGLFSIRELVTNAACHRDYSEQGSKVIVKLFKDRLEIYNIGGFPKGINSRNILSKQYSRNPIVANVLAKVRYIEELGEGWNKIIDEHKKHPLHPQMPKIEADKYSFLVTLYSTRDKFEEKKEVITLTERQKVILQSLQKEGMITTGSCAQLLHVSQDTALRELSKLQTLKQIKQKGVGKSIYYTAA